MFEILVVYTNAPSTTVQEIYDGSGSLNFDINSTFTVDYVEFRTVSNNVNFKITGISLEFVPPL